jgi:hypothetical protein
MNLPTEDEIRAAAKKLGLADEHGNYPRRDRARIAKTIQLAGEQDARAASATAVVLARFRDELTAHGFTHETSGPVVAEAARFLLHTAGLQLEEGTTP